jgi:tetratricopeptide (TPR) repeat protein
VDTNSGVQVWSRTIDKRGNELLRVQEEIANDVVAALELQLSPLSAQRLRKQHTVNPNAYELYLLGRYQQLTRDPAALERAIAFHKEALSLDPTFALAYAGLADAHLGLYYYRGLRLDQSAPEIESDIRHALELDPGLAEGYAARGVLRTEQWRLPEAIADLERAIVLKPNNGESMIRLGVAREYLGEPRDALTQYDRALVLDPLNFPLHVRLCLTLQNMARYADAARNCQRAIELQPEHPNGYWTTGLIALSQGDLPRAMAGYEKALEKAPWRADLLLQLGWIELDAGKPDEARRYFERAVIQEHDNPTAVELDHARFYIAAGTPADLGRFLDGVDIGSFQQPPELFDAALLELVAGRPQVAHSLVQRARAKSLGDSATFENVWDARWGRSARITVALDALARGDHAEAERQLVALERWLDKLEANGQVWHGVKYLRASALAMRGQKPQALAALDDAVRTGWRRAWWTRVDPALSSIRAEQKFAATLAHIRE